MSGHNGHGLKIEGLRFSIGEFALGELSVNISSGTYVVVTGHNGAGKTILLKLIAGLYRPETGSIWINGENMTSLPPWRRNTGYVPQDGTLFPNRSVIGNILFGLEVRGMERKASLARADEIMELLGIGHLKKRCIAGLSGGERQKVSLGRALAFKPSILLLDEPVSAIDEQSRNTICAELKRIQRELKVTTLHISHNSHEITLVADQVLSLKNGRTAHDADFPGML